MNDNSYGKIMKNEEKRTNKNISKRDKILIIFSFSMIVISVVLFIIYFLNSTDNKIKYNELKKEYKVGETFNLDAKYNDKELTFISENPSIVEVDKETGEIKAKKEGTATIEIYVKDDPSVYEYIKIKVKKDDSIIQKPTEEKKEEPKQEETKQEPKQEEKKEEPKQEDKKEQPKQEEKKEEPKQEEKKEEPKQEEKKEEQVQDSTIRVSSLELNKNDLTLLIGEYGSILAKISPENATDQDVLWSSSDNRVASVDTNGNVKGLTSGTAIITASSKDGTKKASCKVNVISPIGVNEIQLDPSGHIIVAVGETVLINTKILPENATNKNIKWSYDREYISIDDKGNLKGIKEGYTDVYAMTEDEHSAIALLMVEVIPENGNISFKDPKGKVVTEEVCGGNQCYINKYTCNAGESFEISVYAHSGYNTPPISVKSYKSGDKTIATIKRHPTIHFDCMNCDYAIVECKKKGKTTLTVTNSLGGSGSINVVVK